jgi:hypothetical protein
MCFFVAESNSLAQHQKLPATVSRNLYGSHCLISALNHAYACRITPAKYTELELLQTEPANVAAFSESTTSRNEDI